MKNPARPLASALLGATLAFGVTSASGAILTLNPAADGYIRASQTAGDTKNTTNHIFLVGHTNATDELRGLLSFNLADPALAGATINSVTLTLYIESADNSSVAGVDTLQLFSLTQTFSEGTVTWTSRDGTNAWTTPGGTVGPLLATTTADADTAARGDALVFSSGTLATSISASIGGSFDLLVALANPDASRDVFRFASRNLLASPPGDPAYIPTLAIDYTPAAIPEPSTFSALAGVGMLGFAVFRRRARR